jgi:hypothetical protein
MGRQGAQRPVERAHRRACRAYDDDIVLHHEISFSTEVAA